MPEFDINWKIPETSGIAKVHRSAAATAALVIRDMKVAALQPFFQTKMNPQQNNLIFLRFWLPYHEVTFKNTFCQFKYFKKTVEAS